MGFYFGTGTQSVTLADNAALDLPNGEWCIAFRARETSRATSSRLVYRSNLPTTANSIEITMGAGAFANEFYVTIVDASDSTLSFPIASNPLNAGDPVNFILQRESDGFVRLYFNAVLAATSNAQLTTAINTTAALWLGNRSDSARPFDGWMAEYVQLSRALTPDERAAHHAGFSPPFFPGRAVYVPAIRDYIELQAGIAVTNNGSTVIEHPAIIYPAGPYIIQAPVAAGSVNILPPLLDNGVTFHNPAFAPGSVSAQAPFLNSGTTLYNPAFAATYSLAMPHLTVAATLYAPTVHATYALAAPHLTNTPTLYDASFAATYALHPPLLDVSPTLYSHSLPGQNITVQAPVLNVPPAFFAHLMREKWSNADTGGSGVWTDTDFPYQEI
jgi:hypothetical protein